jgi:selT/selW/selH-like putative selenoprotein
VPGGRGEFTVTADGQTLWNKHEKGSFPEPKALVAALMKGA